MEKQNLDSLRHTCAHLLAASVLELWPGSHNAIGPSIDDGFYQDFDMGDVKVSESDLPKIEALMRKKVKEWKSFTFKEVSLEEAEELFKHNPYKVALAQEFAKAGKKLSTNNPGGFLDLCKMGHVENPSKDLQNFKLLSIAGAYWRGSEKNKMLTRIYGTAFFSRAELDAYLKMIEEAKKRDHRKLGKELGLFTINNEVGQGITIWLPNGSVIRREIESYMVSEQIKLGFKHVYSPHIGKKSLWEKSGHWDLYREKMYSSMDVDGMEYLVKPMTCPMHIQSYEFTPKSYRDLPYRIAEIGSVYRYEQSGELAGLLRVRAFTQDDAHIFCTPDQAVDEFISVFTFIQKLYGVFGFTDYRVRLGVRSSKEKYLGSDDLWKKAEEKALQALKKVGAKYFISEGDAAFYGPKADFLIKDALGREWQCGTVQIDFMLPERFGLKYIDHEGKEQTPVMVHRAPLGSLERFLAILIENYAGAFPLWLAPVQVMLLPISDKHIPYSRQVYEELKKSNIRVEINEEPATIGKKIRQATLQKIPYMVIMGDQEVEGSTIAVRSREGKDLGKQKINEFVQTLKTTIEKYVS